jgi:hypothetical protein
MTNAEFANNVLWFLFFVAFLWLAVLVADVVRLCRETARRRSDEAKIAELQRELQLAQLRQISRFYDTSEKVELFEQGHPRDSKAAIVTAEEVQRYYDTVQSSGKANSELLQGLRVANEKIISLRTDAMLHDWRRNNPEVSVAIATRRGTANRYRCQHGNKVITDWMDTYDGALKAAVIAVQELKPPASI